MGQEFADFTRTHFRGMFLAVKKEVLFNPVLVCLFTAVTILACANEILNSFEQSWQGDAPL